jgi:hypothetical protein
LWAKNIKQYINEEIPCWSEDWMDRFKKQYGFREFQQHSEVESVDTVEVGRVMDKICDLIKDYHP